ncbi:polymerase/histidinol phosphatase-like protein [Gongronella butleri]|nr:polymerase/histidinol phosphatase-like protein [Gongronella butleri]
MPYSFHSHSGQYCHHGYGQLEHVVQQAIERKFKIYGLSEHMPRFDLAHLYPEELDANCTPDSLQQLFDAYVTEARRLQAKYKDQIELVVGSELEFIDPSYAEGIAALRAKYQLDFVVGSLHHVGRIPIDFSKEEYARALDVVGGGSLVSLFEAYFDEQFAMLHTVKPTVVGHFDLIRIFADQDDAAAALAHPSVMQKIDRNIDAVIAFGGLFEINSRAWKKGLVDAYPCKDIIHQKGGRLTLSDDCHGPQDVGLYYNKLHDYLQAVDLSSIWYISHDSQGKPVCLENTTILHDPFWKSIA